jgi:hypothetical protein
MYITSGRLAVATLWGQHAENFNAESIQQASYQENMFVLFAGMNVSQFLGKFKI